MKMKKAALLLFSAFLTVQFTSCNEASNAQNDQGESSGSESKTEKKEEKKDKIKSIEIGTTPESLNEEVITLEEESKTLKSYAGENGLLVIFSCNTCPFVVAWENRYNDIKERCDEAGIGMVLVNSNAAFREKEDSPESMRKHAEEVGYTAPYVIDENHTIADDFGAKATPHVFLFDGDLSLAYKGLIDDNYEFKDKVEEAYLNDAITAMSQGEEIKIKETKAKGCSIKRVKK